MATEKNYGKHLHIMNKEYIHKYDIQMDSSKQKQKAKQVIATKNYQKHILKAVGIIDICRKCH